MECYVRSNRHSPGVRFLYRGDPKQPVCDFHASQVPKSQLQPIPETVAKTPERVGRQVILKTLEEVRTIMEAVPTGDYVLVTQALKDGSPGAALEQAYTAGTQALVGLIRGRLREEIRWQSTPDGDELSRLFANKMAEWAKKDGSVAFETTFRFFMDLDHEIRVVVEIVTPARELLERARELRMGVAGLKFADSLLEGLNQLSTKLEGFLEDPYRGQVSDVTAAENFFLDLERQAESLRQIQDTRARAHQRGGKRGRRRRPVNQSWKALFV